MTGKKKFTLESPRVLELERGLLGCAILESEAVLPQLREAGIEAADFYKATHRVIFRAICQLDKGPDPVDINLLINHLEDKRTLTKAGGRFYILDLLDKAPTTALVAGYARQIKEKSIRRQLIEDGERIAGVGRDETIDFKEATAKVRSITTSMMPTAGPIGGIAAGGPGFTTWEDFKPILHGITWAWDGWLPDGFVVILGGEPGCGKSALALQIAATFIRGDDWPDDTPYSGGKGSILWCESESAQAINFDRAKKWKIPLEKIRVPNRTDPLSDVRLDDPEIFSEIERNAHDNEIRFIVVDSFSGAHSADENSTEVLAIVKELARLARDTKKPILIIHHLRKRSKFDTGEITLDRFRGSTSIVQPTRVVWALDTPDLSQKERKRLYVIKNNLTRFPDRIGFDIGEGGIEFGEVPEVPHEETQTDKAADLLLALLGEQPTTVSQLQEEAKGLGVSWKTMTRAKKKLNIVAIRKEHGWIWSLPVPERGEG